MVFVIILCWSSYEIIAFGGVSGALSIFLGVSVMLLLAGGWAFVFIGGCYILVKFGVV